MPQGRGVGSGRRAGVQGLMLLLIACLAVGCSTIGSTFGGASSGTQRVLETNTLRVGMAGEYPPMNARSIGGGLIGLDADLAGALASILKVELELVELPIGELIDAVQDGRVDIAISGLTMTPRRNLEVAFAGPYYLARKALMARPEILAGLEDIRELRGRSLRIAAVAGGTSEELVRRTLPDSTHRFVPSQNEAVDLVLQGDADVLVADDPIVRFALLRNRGTGLAFVESKYSAEPIGIAISPDDPLFVNLIQNYLANLEHIGLLDQLRTKWFERDDWIQLIE